MKIGFYLENLNIKNVDTKNVMNGNPGIGGTQFLFLTLPIYLAMYYPSNEYVLLANEVDYLPENISFVKVNSIFDAITQAEKQALDLLVFRPIDDIAFYKYLQTTKQKTIAWSHNEMTNNILNHISKCKNVIKYVCVSRQQLDKIRDHKIFRKSLYIYNTVKIENKQINESKKDGFNITYIGNLIPSKGFHILAKHWPKIKETIPEAKLFVIGSGQLYNRNTKMGELGIAESSYERKIIKYLTKRNKKMDLLESVTFYGILGDEKDEIIKNSHLGIVNPTAKTETFGLGVLDFAKYSIPVVTKAANGYLDTVINNKTGLLYIFNSRLSHRVIKLYKNRDMLKQLGNNAYINAIEKFNPQKISNKWDKLFNDVQSDVNRNDLINLDRYWYRQFKSLKEINRHIKKNSLFSWLPPLVFYEDILRKFKRVLRSNIK